MDSRFALLGISRLRGHHRKATSNKGPAKPEIHLYRRAGRSGAKAVATAIAALMLMGCPTMSGPDNSAGSTIGAVGSARSAQNIAIQQDAQAAMNAQILADRRSLRMEEQAEARRNVQQANHRLEAERRNADMTRDARRQIEIQRQQIDRQRQMSDTGGGGGPNNGRGNQGQGNGQGNQGQGGGQGRQ